jgi:iron complex outermembrane receptor protein
VHECKTTPCSNCEGGDEIRWRGYLILINPDRLGTITAPSVRARGNAVYADHDQCRLWAVSFALCAMLAAPAARAAESEEAELLAVLQQETDIATKTRMNSDFVPGIVTILEGDRMRALGARTVWDAMAYVPGVQPALDGTGTPSLTVRGIPFPFNSGSVQILLNGSPIFREAAGLNGSVLYVPMTQVERIEFIRGPGSILYGDYAFMGLVNIVTRKQGSQLDAGVDSHGARTADLLWSGAPGGWETSINLAGLYSDDAVLPQGSSADETRLSGVANVKYGGFSAQAQVANRQMYDASALHGASPQRDEKNWSGEARYGAELLSDLGVEAHVQYLNSDIATLAASFKGDEVRSGVDMRFSGWSRQTWVAGLDYSDASIDHAELIAPPPPGGGPPPHIVTLNKHRTVASFYAQDQIELLPTLSATLGARYDDNSEIGERVTPRAAIAWQPAEHHILKAQYSEGFRAPTFFELFSPGPQINPLDFEVNRTEEINYVYERPRLTFRATAYRMRIENMVFIDPVHGRFGNVANAKANGAEFELQQQIASSLRLDANLAYVDSRDNRDIPQLAQQAIAEVPHWMGNVGLLWNPSNDWVGGLHWNHIGARPGATPNSGKYDLVDVSLTRRALLNNALELQLGVSNLLDKRVIQLAPGPFGDTQFAYENRVTWARLNWHF